MQEKSPSTAQPLLQSEAVSWWSWRPGTRPLRAFLFGGLLSLLALFLLVNGVTTLIAGILDSTSPPVRVPAIVIGHSKDLLGSQQLTLHLQQAGFPTSVTLVVAPAVSKELANGNRIILDYAPHLRAPYALENGARRFPLPGASPVGNLLQTLALLLCGLLLLPYPSLISFWGWRDLRGKQAYQRVGRVVALRAARQTTTRTPGLLPRTTHIWHGVAVQMEQSTRARPEILIFAIQQDLHARLQRGDRVELLYSPALHHLYALKVLSSAEK